MSSRALYLKHRLAVSTAAPTLNRLRSVLKFRKLWSHPELGVLFEEGRLVDKLMAAFIRKGDQCVDVGGHVGSVSALLRTLTGEDRLSIVEASPTKAAWLSAAFPRARVHAVAVSDEAGEVEFFEDPARPGFSSIIQDRVADGVAAQVVPCVLLDDILPRDPGPSFIKIDIEGFECPALVGATKTIMECRPVILFEAGPHLEVMNTPSTSEELFRLFDETFGYKIFSPFQLEHERPPHNLQSFIDCRLYPFLSFNFFALPNEHPRAADRQESTADLTQPPSPNGSLPK